MRQSSEARRAEKPNNASARPDFGRGSSSGTQPRRAAVQLRVMLNSTASCSHTAYSRSVGCLPSLTPENAS